MNDARAQLVWLIHCPGAELCCSQSLYSHLSYLQFLDPAQGFLGAGLRLYWPSSCLHQLICDVFPQRWTSCVGSLHYCALKWNFTIRIYNNFCRNSSLTGYESLRPSVSVALV